MASNNSKREFELRHCEKKVRYKTKALAGMKASTSSKNTGDIIRPYRCEVCRGWHIGHPDIKKRMQMVVRKVDKKLKTIHKRRQRAGDTIPPNPLSG